MSNADFSAGRIVAYGNRSVIDMQIGAQLPVFGITRDINLRFGSIGLPFGFDHRTSASVIGTISKKCTEKRAYDGKNG